jgi:electron transport complex protein RnfG
MKNDILRLGVILMAFTAIAALLLAGTNLVTAPKIAAQRAAADIAAQQEVLPAAANFTDLTDQLAAVQADYPDMLGVFAGTDADGNPVGMVFKVAPKGYGGPITMMVGIGQDGRVSGMKILSLSETPGLGANADKPAFTGQFLGKSASQPLTVVKTPVSADDQIQALTAATISSRAVTKGVNEALQYYTANVAK